MDLGLTGKVAIVSGASTGIGFGIAEALVREGAHVAVISRNEERIQAAAKALNEIGPANAIGIAQDVTVPGAGPRVVEKTWDALGAPSILITNSGGPAGRDFETLTDEDFDVALRMSFLSAVDLTRAALPSMKETGWGRIVHVSSGTVFEPNEDLFLSSAVRPAVAGFSKALSREVASFGITTNLVCPGYIATDRLTELAERRARDGGLTMEESWLAMRRAVPARRLGTTQELGEIVAFLCGEPASYINGTAIRVDGGKVAHLL
ncbi:MAG: SDR family oxidoreductase [Candidatus Eisenbacteria bacterium]|uniref:SDR family oxidoreductase n=1 Tax=Eiseniibacteriota bacterium TaxID=2212470 RepID=A0A7Y2H1B2_UNCEI|nr:SDR family oxidoreductase [Candidatus Eisenbacteria bacterium]